MTDPLHPFRWLPSPARKTFFIITLIGTLLVMFALTTLGRGLETDSAPNGIVSFEFAGDLATAQQIMVEWGESGRLLAGFHLGLDYLFLVLYPSAIALACVLLITSLSPGRRLLVILGVALAWGQLIAGLLDAIENWALYTLLTGANNPLLPPVAWWCAAVKFALVGVGLAYVLLLAMMALVAYFRRK